jgi:glycosyltransferase involved in cell wall biosynthesis
MIKKISVVFPVYNEEENIQYAIEDFKKIPEVDEIIVVDNNSTDNTAFLARAAGAKVVQEKNQGYGYACQRGLKEAKNEIIVLVEPDGTFFAKDIYKFLAYIDEFDLVLGTRTCKQMIKKGAKMGWFLRVGNIFLAKMVEFLFYNKEIRLTDVGCTYRMIKKKALKKIINNFTVGGNHFSPEMIIEAIINDLKIIEIPINYGKRRGYSKITSNFRKSFILGIKMILLIFKKWFKYVFKKR